MQLDVHFGLLGLFGMAHDPADDFVERFHAGDRDALARCYREHHRSVIDAAARVLGRVDAETVAHDVFAKLIADASMRASFHGGDLGAWLARVARNRAIDFRRKHSREESLPETLPDTPTGHDAESESVAALLVERFEKERLPPEWTNVWKKRFLEQLGQREAATALGMKRTTLMYQEHRIRELLRKFLLEES